MAIPSLRRDLLHLIDMVFKKLPQSVPTSKSPLKETFFCPRNADRKVQTSSSCALFVPLWNKYRIECYRRFCILNNKSKFN